MVERLVANQIMGVRFPLLAQKVNKIKNLFSSFLKFDVPRSRAYLHEIHSTKYLFLSFCPFSTLNMLITGDKLGDTVY